MATIMFVHAHPDDEGTLTAGSMIRAAEEGHRVIVVFATHGEHGEVPDDLGPDETLAQRRMAEAQRAAGLAGVAAVHWLGYRDSGMVGWEQNRHPHCLLQAPAEEAAGRLLDLIAQEQPDVLVGYDWHGNYGHPDHVQVHDAAMLAADLAGIPTRYLATVDREYLHFVESHLVDHAGDAVPSIRPIGSATVEITTTVAIHDLLDVKQRAIAAHESQIGSDPWLGVPDDFADVILR